MKNINFNNILILIAIIIGVGIYIDIRRSGVLFGDTIVTTRDTVIVNLPEQTFNFAPGKPVTIINEVPANVDTSAILKAYFSELTYNDSLVNDTVAFSIKESVTQNSIRSRELKWRLKMPIQTIVEIHNEKKGQLCAGGMVTFRGQSTIAPTLGYKNKNDWFMFGSYDPWTKGIQGGLLIPLRKQ